MPIVMHSLLRDFREDFSLFLATIMSKKTLWPAFSSSVAQDLTKGSRSEISFRRATERSICSLRLFFCEHREHSVASQYLMYMFKQPLQPYLKKSQDSFLILSAIDRIVHLVTDCRHLGCRLQGPCGQKKPVATAWSSSLGLDRADWLHSPQKSL